ncbi:MAG: hypothetical protein ACWGNV_14275, partial [Bacteroidales bacterium]
KAEATVSFIFVFIISGFKWILILLCLKSTGVKRDCQIYEMYRISFVRSGKGNGMDGVFRDERLK